MVVSSGAASIRSSEGRAFSSYEFLKLIEEKGQVGFWAWDFAAGTQNWSIGICRIFGLEPGSVQPTMDTFMGLLHPDDRAGQAQQLDDVVRHGIMPDREYRIIRPGGGLRWVSCRGEVQFSREGRPQRAFGVLFDITTVQEASRAAQWSEQRFRTLAEATASIVWTATADGIVIDAPAWRSLTGQTIEEFRDSGWLDAVHPDDRGRTALAWHHAIANSATFHAQYRLRMVSGGYGWFNVRAAPVRGATGAVREWMGLLQPLQDGMSGRPADTKPLITGAQIRAARGLLRWSEEDLSKAARVSRSTVRRAEEVDDLPSARFENLQAIRAALEEAGVELTFPLAGQPGVQPK
ncbi:MAG TPA: PAS domain-containing protein [Beijerinckiaceae bacterium]|nr:PAS domain-containing protein [Beijerinckiaceae bacterium]